MESPEKALDAGKHERTAIARPAEAQPVFGLHASFEAAWRPAHGEAQGFRLRTPNTACSGAVANNPDVSARSRFEGKRLPRTARFAKARSGAGWKPAKAGVLPGKLTEPVNTLYALEAEGQRSANKKVSVASAPSSLKLRSASKAGRFCRSRRMTVATAGA